LTQVLQKSGMVAIINRSCLGKCVTTGVLIGLVAGFGSTFFYFIINLVTIYLLGGESRKSWRRINHSEFWRIALWSTWNL